MESAAAGGPRFSSVLVWLLLAGIVVFLTTFDYGHQLAELEIDQLFYFMNANIYTFQSARVVLIQPMNWIIYNNISSGELWTFGTFMADVCGADQTVINVFVDRDLVEQRCWYGTKTVVLNMMTGQLPQSVKLKSWVDNKKYSIVHAINELLDRGYLVVKQHSNIPSDVRVAAQVIKHDIVDAV